MFLSVQKTGKSIRSQYGPAQCCGLKRDIRDTRDSGDGGWWSVGQKCWNAVTMRGDTVWTLYTLYTGHLTAAPQHCQYPAEGRGWTHWPGMRWLPRPYWVQLPCGFGQPTLDTTQVGYNVLWRRLDYSVGNCKIRYHLFSLTCVDKMSVLPF